MDLPPLPDPSTTRRKTLLVSAIGFLILFAILVLVLPRLPLPLRLAVAGTDLIAAAIIALLLRQQYGRRD